MLRMSLAFRVQHFRLNTLAYQKLERLSAERAVPESSILLFLQIEPDKVDQDVAVTGCNRVCHSCFTEGKKSLNVHNILATIRIVK